MKYITFEHLSVLLDEIMVMYLKPEIWCWDLLLTNRGLLHVDEILYIILPSVANFHENLIKHVLKNVVVASKLFDLFD